MIDLQQGDCLELMQQIPRGTVDLILADLPYGITANKWDSIIPMKQLWKEYKRVIKHNGIIALFSSGKFTSKLIESNYDMYKYKWIWVKNTATNAQNSHYQPMRSYEEINIFTPGAVSHTTKTENITTYNPQGLKKLKKPILNKVKKQYQSYRKSYNNSIQKYTNYPKDVLFFNANKPINSLHPTQKPVDLLEYLIKTYTNEGETVLDNTMGSGSTGVACVNTNRNFIGYELNDKYFEIANNRINQVIKENE